MNSKITKEPTTGLVEEVGKGVQNTSVTFGHHYKRSKREEDVAVSSSSAAPEGGSFTAH